VYGPHGHLVCVREGVSSSDCTTGTVYWKLEAADQNGALTREWFGNNVTTVRTYNPTDGTLTALKAGTNANQDNVQNLAFGWDKVGNVLSRTDAHTNVVESFTYDALYRLAVATTTENGGTPVAVAHAYDAVGNLLKLGTQATGYAYGAKPHAVTQVVKGGVTHDYAYDANGNLATVTAGGSVTKRVCWSTSNHATFIGGAGTAAGDCTAGTPAATVWSRFYYDPSRARYKQVHHTASGDETTIYVGSLYERVTKPSGLVEHRHYISGAGRVVALYTKRSDATQATEYWHRDHLDSVIVRTDAAGAVIERSRYDAWGKRLSGGAEKRGYTGHEMLDDLGLIHMNGRVYDPEIGRFLSADPFVQFPESTQGFNRYAYVGNNPLSYNDPSGHFIVAIIMIAQAAATTAVNAYLMAAVIGFATYVETGGNLKAAALAMASAGIASGIGSAFGTGALTSSQIFAKALLHGLSQGVLTQAGGGRFGDGFIGGFTSGLMELSAIKGLMPKSGPGQVIVSAMVGGTLSKIGGGKFANGAYTAAAVALFNKLGNHMTKEGRALQERMDAIYKQHEDAGHNDCADFAIDVIKDRGVTGSGNLSWEDSSTTLVEWAKGTGYATSDGALAAQAARNGYVVLAGQPGHVNIVRPDSPLPLGGDDSKYSPLSMNRSTNGGASNQRSMRTLSAWGGADQAGVRYYILPTPSARQTSPFVFPASK
jgi:RHS repeat-associated protein